MEVSHPGDVIDESCNFRRERRCPGEQKNLEVSNCARSAETNAFPSSKTLLSHWRRCKNKEMATHSDTYYKGIPQKPQNCKRKASTLLILRRRSNSKGQVHGRQKLCICVLRAARRRGHTIRVKMPSDAQSGKVDFCCGAVSSRIVTKKEVSL